MRAIRLCVFGEEEAEAARRSRTVAKVDGVCVVTGDDDISARVVGYGTCHRLISVSVEGPRPVRIAVGVEARHKEIAIAASARAQRAAAKFDVADEATR